MTLPDVCALCYGSHGGGTFDVDDNGTDIALVLVNVCADCRMAEIRLLIVLRSAYEGNGHSAHCCCLECRHSL